MSDSQIETVYGRNPVLEVLRAGRRRVHRVLIAESVEERGTVRLAREAAGRAGVAVERVRRADLDRLTDAHQGIAAVVDPYPYTALEDVLDRAVEWGEAPLVLLLDVVQNPQNLATLMRTAEGVGVHGVVIPYRRGAGVTPAVTAASAGASEHLLVARENLARAIARLKQAGVWIVGLEALAEARPIDEADLGGPLALVVGSEGEGMRRLVRDSCDLLVRLPMRGRVGSLNAAVAGSIALYAAWQARGFPRRAVRV
jgi:23S rRNA (guanosine2251-2'-O)-methyltransferase